MVTHFNLNYVLVCGGNSIAKSRQSSQPLPPNRNKPDSWKQDHLVAYSINSTHVRGVPELTSDRVLEE